MNNRLKKIGCLLAVGAGVAYLPVRAQVLAQLPALQIQANRVVAPVGPMFSGMMTEEINHSYDGGLYGELIQNRALADDLVRPVHWTSWQSSGTAASIALDQGNPLNGQLPNSLRLEVSQATPAQPAGVVNDGYWGIPLKPHTVYRVSFYAKAAPGFAGKVTVSLNRGKDFQMVAQASVGPLTGEWQKFETTLTTSRWLSSATDGRFRLTVDGPGTVWLDLVSLFPPTWHDRPNGNRVDLMQKLADMKPTFLRFPGGNYLEGSTIATRFPWKQTLGDLATRPGHPGCWGYRSTDGLGLLEFLEWAEDLKAKPLLAVYAGYSLPPKSELVRPGDDLAPYVTDALNEIEYVMGDTNTVWGARRAADGHPAPFDLHYVEIGNEDWFDNSGTYDARFTQFYDAIKAKYPGLECISTVGNEQPERKRVHSRKPDLVDEHYYRAAADFAGDGPAHFDSYDRNGPKIFVGEWAAYEDIVPWDAKSRKLPPTPTFKAALSDAAWLTAMERNADIVLMQCYAPMLVNVNPGGRQWRPNLIGYDNLNSYGSPSYYVIKMFNENRGDVVVASHVNTPAGQSPLNYSVTKDTATGNLYIKLVNPDAQERQVQIHLQGVARVKSRGASVVMTAPALTDGNSLAQTEQVVPKTRKLSGVGPVFLQKLPASSITILKIVTE